MLLEQVVLVRLQRRVQLQVVNRSYVCLVHNGYGYGLLFHMTQPTSRSIIKAIACGKPTISEH